jgi:hypothetical protein
VHLQPPVRRASQRQRRAHTGETVPATRARFPRVKRAGASESVLSPRTSATSDRREPSHESAGEDVARCGRRAVRDSAASCEHSYARNRTPHPTKSTPHKIDTPQNRHPTKPTPHDAVEASSQGATPTVRSVPYSRYRSTMSSRDAQLSVGNSLASGISVSSSGIESCSATTRPASRNASRYS